jgi:hypothetical protein
MRKNIIIAAVVATFSLSVMASEEESLPAMTVCSAYSSTAKEVMLARHAGVDMSRMLEIMADDDIGVSIVMRAFEHPQYRTEQAIQRSAREFANQEMLACMKAFNKQGTGA